MTQEDKILLERAAHEIQSLRRANELMGTRLQVFDQMMALLFAQPPNDRHWYTEDVVSIIEKHILSENEKKA